MYVESGTFDLFVLTIRLQKGALIGFSALDPFEIWGQKLKPAWVSREVSSG